MSQMRTDSKIEGNLQNAFEKTLENKEKQSLERKEHMVRMQMRFIFTITTLVRTRP